MSIIGQNIRRVREFSGLNQKQFAETFGIVGRKGKPSEDMLGTYERGITDPPAELLKKIAAACKIDLQRLSEDELKLYDLKEIELPSFETERFVTTLNEPPAKYTNVDFKDKFYKQLEENNTLLKGQVKLLTEVVKKVETSLETALVNQREIAAMNSAFRKLFVDWMGKTKHQDPKTLLRTLHIDAVRIMKVFDQKGSLLEIDNGDNQ